MIRSVTIFNGFETAKTTTQISNLHTSEEGVRFGEIVWRGRVVVVRDNGPNGWSGRTT